jgi:o-succinylbenzoate---CoA ligase
MRLSILDAANEAPSVTALIEAGAPISYRALAAEVERALERLEGLERAQGTRLAFVPLVAERTRATIVDALALLERKTPILFLHPRLVAEERDALIRRTEAARIEEGTAAIFFTSGTTGAPKGAQLSERAFIASADASARHLGWRANDRWLLALPLAHIGGFSIVTRSLLARRTIVLPEGTARFDEEVIVRAIERDQATIASLVPSMLVRLLERAPAWRPPPGLRAILLGGAPAPAALLASARERGVPILTTYGLTEACAQVTLQALGTLPDPKHGAGAPLAQIEVRVRGGSSEIEVRGPTMMLGYLGIDRTMTFDHAGWFATGDFGRFDEEGRLHLLGRRSDLIVTGGENVYPLELERALEACAEVRTACVLGLPDERWGEIVCAVIVARDPSVPVGLVIERVERFGREHLAAFKRPKRIEVVEALPVSEGGKVDRGAVRRLEALLRRGSPPR